MTDDNPDTKDTAEQSDDYVVLPASATDEDVEYATPYHAKANDIAEYGVFVRLAGEYPDDVGGLVHETNLPTGYTPDDFAAGDTFVVQLCQRSDEQGLGFEVVRVLEGVKDTSGVKGAPVRDYSPTEDEDGDETTDTTERPASVPPEPRLDAITTRLDAIEGHLGMDAPTVRARVVDAGEDTTLLRVLDDEGEIDANHGEVVTVRLHETETG